ncbi:hypothetical protein A9995_11410 [Erythrobacter sp. QSSC1-22B]|uniref:hypothetical protein n=1 Tax=Erythrobacter sp. QSSC1-22B TaxID=1860125 RepID=UPI00080580BE|nr:hypothetical protein [Erythrobacter sp. QSSC1-22B]OBX18567.1 hypothetical protein A9995_11410 [Erythrobacter sp. QSSC1-22B]
MISTLRPLLTEFVEHWQRTARDIHGTSIKTGATRHAARVIYFDGEVVSPFTKAKLGNARAAVWLIDHPRPVALGDHFELPDGQTLAAIRTELRTLPGGTLHKVFLT